jgi:hypothetical protein
MNNKKINYIFDLIRESAILDKCFLSQVFFITSVFYGKETVLHDFGGED